MKRSIIVCVIILSFQITLYAQNDSISHLEKRADSLFAKFEEENALKAYQQILKQRPNDHEALWKTSFLYARVGFRLDNEDRKQEYYNKAIELAEKALETDSAHTQSHFVMAVAMGRKAMISKAREKVEASKVIKEHVDKALEADSTNSGAWHVLGRWHFKIANLNFLERLAANALYGGVPKEASNERAEEAIEKAIELNPKYPLYYYDLALVYDERGKKGEASNICRQALKLNDVTPDDQIYKENCRQLIRELQ